MSHQINKLAKNSHQVTLTDEAWSGLQSIAESLGFSVSELLEKVGCSQMVVLDSEELEDLLDTIDGLEGIITAKEEGSILWEEAKAKLSL